MKCKAKARYRELGLLTTISLPHTMLSARNTKIYMARLLSSQENQFNLSNRHTNNMHGSSIWVERTRFSILSSR